LADLVEAVDMPAISFFADGRDANILVDRLNADPEIAFIVPDGPLDPEEAYANRLRASVGDRTEATFYGPFGIVDDGYRQRWKAVRTVEGLKDGNHGLWHIPAGPLPLLAEGGSARGIPDPWAGWTEQWPGADPTTPYFGPGHAAHIRLELWTRHRPYSDEENASLPMRISYWDREQDIFVASDFQWIGGHYSPPPPQTRRWWDRLKAWFGRSAAKLADGRQTFWAFPSALRKLKGGTAYYSRGWDLSESIRTAELNLRPPEVRDLIPPSPVAVDPAWLQWNGGTVSAIARRIYDERAFHDLPILADALEEAGCTNPAILDHCHQSGEHVRGCWVVDMILGSVATLHAAAGGRRIKKFRP
jgi:hypothetical protein